MAYAASNAPEEEREGPLRQGEQRERAAPRAAPRGSLTWLPSLFLLAVKIGIGTLIAVIYQTLIVRSVLNIFLVDVVESRLTEKRAQVRLLTRGHTDGRRTVRVGVPTTWLQYRSQHAQLQPGTGKVSAEPQFRLLLRPAVPEGCSQPQPQPRSAGCRAQGKGFLSWLLNPKRFAFTKIIK